jgi:Zn-dependent protease
MFWRNWQIGLVFGIPIKVHPSWFFVFLFVTWTLATGYLPVALPGLTGPRYWVLGAIASVLMFVSVLLHELGHSLVALRYRIPIGQITLFIFGGVAHMKREPPGPLAEFLIAIAGPIVSFALGAFCFGLESFVGLLHGNSRLRGLLVLSGLLAMVNINLGVFNLIPGFPLDGGRALRAGLWAWSKDFHTATSQASLVGVGAAVLIGISGGFLIVGALTGALPGALATNGLWVVIIGAFLFAAARHSRRQAMVRASLAGVPVRQLMVRVVVDLKPEMSLEQAVNQCFLP